MKKLISMILCGLLLFLLISCEKNEEESTTSEKSTTAETTTEETISKLEEEFHLFNEDMVINFDDYKPCEYEDDKYIIKARIPESWSFEVNNEKSDDVIGSLNLCTGKENDNLVGTVGINRILDTSFYDCDWNFHKEDFKIISGLTGRLSIASDEDMNHIDDKVYNCNITFENIPDIIIYFVVNKDATQEEKQEIFNVLNSIEISEHKEQFDIFNEDMETNYDGYKTLRYDNGEDIIRVEIPENWSYKLYKEGDEDLHSETSPYCGYDLYKNDNKNSIISIRKYKCSISTEDYDYSEEFNGGVQGMIYYRTNNDNTIQALLSLRNSGFYIFINPTKKEIFEENKQEIFNVLNSIETIGSDSSETSISIVENKFNCGEWTLTSKCLGNAYSTIDITNVVNNFVIYNSSDKAINIFDIKEDISYKITYDLSDYKIYYVDNDYLFAFKNNNNDDYSKLNLIKYDYKNFKAKKYTVDISNYLGESDYYTYYKGCTYCVYDGCNEKRGLLKIDENMNITLIQIDKLSLGYCSVFVYNNILYVEPCRNCIYKVTDDDKAVQIKNCELYESPYDGPIPLISWEYYKANICFENYSLDENYTIYYDEDKHTLFIKNMLNDETINISTDVYCPELYGIKINDNKHRIVLIGDKVYIYILERKTK